MKDNIHFFSATQHVTKDEVLDRIGNRGRDVMNLAALKLPIIPGFIFDADGTASIEQDQSLADILKTSLGKVTKAVGKTVKTAAKSPACLV